MDHVTDRCTANEDGDFCDAPSMTGAPYPICARHALEVYQHMTRVIGDALADPLKIAAAVHQINIEDHVKTIRQTAHALNNPPAAPVVYYLRVGDLIKIGTTRNLGERLRTYPPHAVLLGLEPGSTEIERLRLEQFGHLLAGRAEWFRDAPELRAHIEQLKASAAA